ncbi:MAG: flavin reductase [Pelolinea sp.]|nr:flavin reductase [Pelolinea sp.]
MEQHLQDIPVRDLKIKAFDLWDKDWLLLTSGDYSKGKFNAMTVAWGSIGNMWNLPFALVVVRPTRYTFEFINSYPSFSLCGFPEEYRKALNIMGTKSGRDSDKLSESGLTATKSEMIAAPVFEEAELVIECRKIYIEDFNPTHFIDDRIDKNYPNKDYHRMIFGEILTVRGLEKKYASK